MSAPSITAPALGGLLVAALITIAAPARAADPPVTDPPTAPAPAAPSTSGASPDAAAPATEAAAGEPAADSDQEDAADENPPTASESEKAGNPPSAVFATTAAAAPPAAEQPKPDDGKLGTHQQHWAATIGGRFGYIPATGYDPFSENNGFQQVSLGVGRTLMAMDEFSTAVWLLWDWGSAESTARGAETSLGAHRLTVGLEGRYHLLRRLYLFARVAPGALRSDATLYDAGAGVERVAGDWVFATDLSGGAAFEFAGENRGASRLPRGWLSVDGGYGFTTASTLEFVAEPGSNAPARLEPIDLGDLAMSGGFFRVAASATF